MKRPSGENPHTRLAEHTSTAATNAFEDVEVAVLPVGSTEQHGPALLLGTDYMVAERLAATLADRDDVAVLPTLPVGVSEHHRQFDGTLWLDPETFEAAVTETIESVVSHGGNTDALRRAARRLRAAETAFAPSLNWWEAIDIDAELDAPVDWLTDQPFADRLPAEHR